ncbi:GNAT family N-acetyltransferase [Deinococcus sp. HMF7604]|uniref:GNAT family N-acetyltransferase n=1 Tax=Deinococcus betulae TaxID=2873312 RepID=UPI001CCE6B2F|nr:GNAT family N-acetyltransferase [Deinococcus betulae]MBZ9751831.1 GNAT family N-acetyltransferase [Deinococcus betulae]
MPPFTVRRLRPGDEAALAQVAADETDFTEEDPSPPLSAEEARAYLADPHVWHWHADDEHGQPVGFLMAYVHRRRHRSGTAETACDVMFEEIGVRESWRRAGVGRALVAALHSQMQVEGLRDVWVAADNEGAQAFYATCGYEVDELQGVILSREV